VIDERETLENEDDAVSPLLEISELEVRYPSFVLGPINLGLESGEIASLLGPNGSGKTTLIRSVMSLQGTNSGRARFNGESLAGRPPQLLSQIGYLTDSADDIIPELTPQEYWEFCALAYSRFGGSVGEMLDRARGIANALGLSPERRAIGSFSLGMRRKAQLVACMLHSPELLVLDEPLIGLDFMSIKALEALLAEERRRGASVWVSSHDLALAYRLADRVFVLHLGSMVLDVKTREISSPAALEDMIMVALRLKAARERA